ncbi:MAG: hypothetical protein U1E05_11465 [Patescibacteria group bacterium]|nr:hypothetical protein [Patescibacteria group bacterium]
MQRSIPWFSFALAIWTGAAGAQQPGSAVQLPTFSQFSVGTTVSVPDRGSAYMGGINRSASGRTSYGAPMLPFRPFRNTAIGGSQGGSSMHVSAWVHDFEAMDDYLLNQPPRTVQFGTTPRQAVAGSRQPPSLDPAWNVAGGGSVAGATHGAASWQPAAEASPSSGLLTVDEERQRRQNLADTRATEAHDFFERGQTAEAAGKTNVAKIYYQMAARRATGDLHVAVLAKLQAIAQEQTGQSVARSDN